MKWGIEGGREKKRKEKEAKDYQRPSYTVRSYELCFWVDVLGHDMYILGWLQAKKFQSQ